MRHAISLRHHRRTVRVTPRLHADSRLQQAAWFGGVSAIAFLVPLVFSSWLELHHDVYYLVYFATVAVVLATYVTREMAEVRLEHAT